MAASRSRGCAIVFWRSDAFACARAVQSFAAPRRLLGPPPRRRVRARSAPQRRLQKLRALVVASCYCGSDALRQRSHISCCACTARRRGPLCFWPTQLSRELASCKTLAIKGNARTGALASSAAPERSPPSHNCPEGSLRLVFFRLCPRPNLPAALSSSPPSRTARIHHHDPRPDCSRSCEARKR